MKTEQDQEWLPPKHVHASMLILFYSILF